MANKQLLKNLLLIALGVASRLIPHPANFTAITGIAVFSGNIIVPLSSMLISDVFLGFDSLYMRLTVYGCIILAVLIGKIARKNSKFSNIAAASLVSSTFFFVITNFAVWKFGIWYAKSPAGLLNCYLLAIPFFRNAIMGDFFYAGALFGIQKLASFNIFRIWASKQRA